MKIDLMSRPPYKKFFTDFSKRMEILTPLPLPEQRKLGLEMTKAANTCHERIHKLENIFVPALDHHKIPVRIYIPSKELNLPIFVYYHGGGWVYGSIEDSDSVARRIANHLHCIVASVDYRLAPEHPFPKPLEDCYSATKWIAEHAGEFGGDKNQIIVGGESAGGNLAAAVALMARDKNAPKIAAQVLIYPVISSTLPKETFKACPDQYFVTWDFMNFFWTSYIQTKGQEKNPYASLDHAKDLKHLPPALVITAEYDPLKAEGDHYASMLKKAGVHVIEKTIPEALHGCLYINLFDESKRVELTQEIKQELNKLIKK